MARGWESKDVESQQELRAERQAPLREKSPEQQEIESLQLQRTRVLTDLQSACNPRYRAQLEASLRYLEDRIAELSFRLELQPPAASPPR